MPFLQAGFNGANFKTGIRGWTRHVRGGRFAPAELRYFDCGDFFWLGLRKRHEFLVWGDYVVLGTWHGFRLAHEHQYNLPMCNLDTRRECGRWINGEWLEPQ